MDEQRRSKNFAVFGDTKEPVVFVGFPFAGGSADVFKDWCHYVDLQVLAVQYRGRFPGGVGEPILMNLELIAKEVCDALEATCLKSTEAFFYGHSYGAIVAWLVAELLQEKKSHITVIRLFVGAEASPRLCKSVDTLLFKH
jgi:surfactin synthase thioesterase subunit